MVYHGNHESKMNQTERMKVNLITRWVKDEL
jgi:hypothetical protein